MTNSKKVDIKKNRIIWLDILKILACFFVIINHTGTFQFNYSGYNNYSVLFYSIFFAICKMGVPIFLMSSGILLLSKETSYKESFKRIYRILVPLLIVSAFLYLKSGELSIDSIKTFLSTPTNYAYWYLYMMIGLYLILPFLQKMIKNLETTDFRNLIIVCLLIPGLLLVITALFGIQFSNFFTLANFAFPISFCIAGIYIEKLELNKKYRNIAFCSLVIPLIIFTLSIYIPYLKGSGITYKLDCCYYITTALPALALFYLIRYYFSQRTFNHMIETIISETSSVTFGIYLFHVIVIGPLLKFVLIQKCFQLNSYIGILFFQLLCFFICGLFTYLLKKIPIIKKFL